MAQSKKAAEPAKKGGDQVIALNKKAYHDYLIRETMEAGLVLTGTEIKSIRAGKVNMREAYAKAEPHAVWLHNLHIAQYDLGNRWNHEPTRPRKLLLHRREIQELWLHARQGGRTLVPLRLYLRGSRAKLELGLARGKHTYDKREVIAERDRRRDLDRAMAPRQAGR